MGCLWWVRPKPLGQACWTCLVVPVVFWLGVSPWRFLPWMGVSVSVVCALLVGGLCVACSRLAFVVGIWWGLVDAVSLSLSLSLSLSIEPLSCFPYLPFFAWLLFQGNFVYYVIYFSFILSFIFFLYFLF